MGCALIVLGVLLTQVYFGQALIFRKYVADAQPAYAYNTTTLEVPLDHFSFTQENKTFLLRVLYNATWWDRSRGPIFFYTGNEGDIELFAQNTGFMWEIAPSFRALLVFAEHRYYGKSLPFGNESLSQPKFSGYLTSQQALADFVDVIDHFQSWRGDAATSRAPVVAFGGSYGGMLSAWMRIKYPASVVGAIAASAPVLQFEGVTPCDAFARVTTSAYEDSAKGCSSFIRQTWSVLRNVTSKDTGLDWLKTEYKMCQKMPSAGLDVLFSYLQNAYEDMAMINYPYPSNFLAPVPAYPVKVMCDCMLSNGSSSGSSNGSCGDVGGNKGAPLPPGVTSEQANVLRQLFRGISVYFNYTGEQKCFNWNDTGTSSLGYSGWDFQVCSELPMPMCSDEKNDMFFYSPWDEKAYTKECQQKYQVQPEYYLPRKIYGGKDLAAASNIIFSNGLLDPWSSGGVLFNASATARAVLIPEGAHHLDLRASNPADPTSVRKARAIHRRSIKEWIRQHWQQHNARHPIGSHWIG